MEIRSLANTGFDEVFEAWQDAFAGYEKSWTRNELQSDLARRGYKPEMSFGAFSGDRLISFVLNGQGMYQNKHSFYDTGTGTIREYQGQGLARKILTTILPRLSIAGGEQYILEVLQKNEHAIKLYSGLDFKITRGLNYFYQDMAQVQIKSTGLPPGLVLREIDLGDTGAMMKMWDFDPSWQNSLECVRRVSKDFIIVGALYNEQLAGYGIIAPSSGDIPQLAVGKEYRRKGIATAIFGALTELNRHSKVKIVNTEASCKGMTSFLTALGIPLRGAQYEMVYRLKEPSIRY